MFFSNPNSNIGHRLKDWWVNIPAYTRLILYVTLFVYALTWISLYFIIFFVNTPYSVIREFQFWRLFTFSYVPSGILNLILEMISFLPYSCRAERRLGTSKYFVYFLLNSVMIGALYSLSLFILSLIPIGYFELLAYSNSAGLWPIIMMEMVIQSNKNPDQATQFFLCPIQMKSKYFPFVFLIIFSFLGVFWELIFGLMFGYLRKRYLDVLNFLNFTILGDDKASNLEDTILCIGLRKMPNFIDVVSSGDEELPTFQERAEQMYPSINPQNQNNNPTQPPVQPFSGQGYRLGGDEAKTRNFNKVVVT